MIRSRGDELLSGVLTQLAVARAPVILDELAHRIGLPHRTVLYGVVRLQGEGKVERTERGYQLTSPGRAQLRVQAALEEQLDDLLTFVSDCERDWALDIRLALLR
jgi:predicted transcriptional regulator